MNPYMMNREDVAAIGIDLQENLMPAMAGQEEVEANTVKFLEGLKVFGIPRIFSQQYTRGLGETIASVKAAAGEDATFIEKRSFSAMKVEGFPEAVKDTGKKTIMIFGVESHVCMMQTSFDLLAAGYEVYVISDCCTSRRTDDHQEAMNRLGAAGATVTTYEAALFELLVTSESPDFKAISNIVK